VLPSTRHKRTHPASTPARQAGTRFTDHLRIDGGLSKPGPRVQRATGPRLLYATARGQRDTNTRTYLLYACMCVCISAKETNDAYTLSNIGPSPVRRTDEDSDVNTVRSMNNEQSSTTSTRHTVERERGNYSNNSLKLRVDPPGFYEFKLPYAGTSKV